MAKQKTTTEVEEVVAEEVTQQLVVPELPKIASMFLVGDQEINKALLLKRKAETDLLVIVDATDTNGYKIVQKAVAEYRTTRTQLEKKRKENVAPVLQFMKDYKANVDELGEICSKEEAALTAKMQVIDDEKERIKKEKEEAAARKVQERINNLVQLGAVFNADQGTYSFPYDDVLFTSAVQIEDFSDTEYKEFLEEVTESHTIEQQRIADEKEAERLAKVAADEEAERIRLQGIAQDEQKTALLDKQVKLRSKELKMLGFVPLDEQGDFANKQISLGVPLDYLKTMDDEKWDAFIEKLETDIEVANQPKPEPEETPVVIMGEPLRSSQPSSGLYPSGFDFETKDDEVLIETTIAEFQKVPCTLEFTEYTLFEDIQIAAKFFLRVHCEPLQDDTLKVINKGQFKSGPLFWTLIQNAE